MRFIRKLFRWKKMLYALYVLFIVFISLEIILRIYNPFPFRLSGDKVILATNRKMVISNNEIPVLGKTIIHTKNNIGFRGPDKPAGFDSLLTIIAVGGSTTECFYLQDDSCWTASLYKKLQPGFSSLWMNNAGLQGHSTFGHYILINEYIKYLKPKVVLLLVGCNEVGRTDLFKGESVSRKSWNADLISIVRRKSEVVNLLLNLRRKHASDKKGVTDKYLDLHHPQYKEYSARYCDSVADAETPVLNAYKERLSGILDTLKANNITPVLISQPTLFGNTKDSITGADLGLCRMNDIYNGSLWWRLLSKYNEMTKTIALSRNICFIDLANQLPKNSLYFYDVVHFTNEGSEKVSGIIYDCLKPYLQTQFHGFKK
jgi:lysophospholipase L1-like esterase